MGLRNWLPKCQAINGRPLFQTAVIADNGDIVARINADKKRRLRHGSVSIDSWLGMESSQRTQDSPEPGRSRSGIIDAAALGSLPAIG